MKDLIRRLYIEHLTKGHAVRAEVEPGTDIAIVPAEQMDGAEAYVIHNFETGTDRIYISGSIGEDRIASRIAEFKAMPLKPTTSPVSLS